MEIGRLPQRIDEDQIMDILAGAPSPGDSPGKKAVHGQCKYSPVDSICLENQQDSSECIGRSGESAYGCKYFINLGK